MAVTPKYTISEALAEMEKIIRGWGMANANETQLAQLRGIRDTLKALAENGTFKDKSGMVGVV